MRALQRDWVVAALLAVLALGLYWRTLYPGLVGDGDTPKFQYVGAVGGTPHNPGYPLYLTLSYAFSRLPAGNLAWRMNLMSAVFAALAVGLLFRLGRALGSGRGVAAAVALAAGCGPVFWSQATLAEVYTLAAALLLGVLAALVSWSHAPRRPGLLLLACGVFALGLGHQVTIVTLLPALFAYALLVDRRAALRPGMLAAAALLQVAGLAQYLLILVRTRQGAPYLGSEAHTLAELLDVVRGAQFADRLFAFDLATVVGRRLPELARLCVRELGPVGLGAALVGLGLLARRRDPAFALLALGLAGMGGFALNYRADDTPVFLIPVFLLLWVAAGVALQALWERWRGRWTIALVPALAALPAGQLLLHFKASDHSDRTFEMRYFRALVERVPAGSMFLAESYTVDQMLLYELLGEGFTRRRSLRLVPRDAQSVETYARRNRPLFAFERARRELAPQGFRFEPVALPDGPLHEVIARLPRGSLVLLAGRSAGEGLRETARALGVALPGEQPFALAAVAGVGPPRVASGPLPLELAYPSAGVPGAPVLRVDEGGAAVLLVGDREQLRSAAGAVVAWLNPHGRVVEALAVAPQAQVVVPFSRRAFPLFRVAQLPDGTRLRAPALR